MKFWKKVLIGLVALILLFIGLLLLEVRSLTVEKINDDLFVIRGMGGNTTVLKTNAGAVVVDSMTFKMQGKLIQAKAEELTGHDVVMLINTHYHLDHTHGNPGFKPGIQIVSTERTLSHLKALDADFWQGDAGKLLPNQTFSDRKTIPIGNKTIELIHPGRGHTDGDLIVHFVDDGAIALGDLFFNQHYPNIDLEAGGSVQDWPATLSKVLAMDAKFIIPGHGDTTDKSGLAKFQDFIAQLASIGRGSAINKLSLEDTLATANLTQDQGYTEITFAGIPLGLDRTFVLTRTWQEANGDFERKN